MIVLTGATGKLGSLIIERLLDRMSPDNLAVSVRDPGAASNLAVRGVRVRHGDFAQPDTLPQAFEGAEQLLFVSSGAQAHGGDPLAQHRAAIAAATAAGARRILYTAHMAASSKSRFQPMHVHAATEAMLAECGIAWTSLRNGFYASRAMQETSEAIEKGVIQAPQDGPVSWTTHADLAEAAAVILEDEGRFEGPTPPLVGSEALAFGDIATLVSELTGKLVRRVLISDIEAQERVAARGLPPAVGKITAGFYEAARAGEFAAVDPTLEQLLGRKPETVRSLIAAKIGG